MAAHIRYDRELLLFLKDSPLCIKPERLPPREELEKWMDLNLRQKNDDVNNQRSKRGPSLQSPDALQDNPLARFAGAARKNTRGQEGDIILGPPKMGFTSNNRNATKTEDATTSKDRGEFQEGFFRARSNDPLRDKVPRRTRETGDDGFTVVRNRRSSQAEDGASKWSEREEKPERVERERRDPLDIPLKRNGVGRGFDKAWIRPDHTEAGESSVRPEQTKNMSWRDRESQKDRDHREHRGWGRNARDAHNEEQPEWMMDDTQETVTNNAKTQEEFQAWKEAMRAKNPGLKNVEKPETTKPPAVTSSKSANVLPTLGIMFGTFEDKKKPEEKAELVRPTPIKSKSRFEGFFKKEEPPVMPAPPPPEAIRPISRGEHNGNAEDKAGFDRILAMLANTSTPVPRNQQPPPGLLPDRGLMSPEIENASVNQRSEHHRDNGFMEDLLARQLAGARIGGQSHPSHPFMDGRSGPAVNTNVEKESRAENFSPRANEPNPNAQREFLYNLMMNQQSNMPQRGNESLEFGQFGGPPKGIPQQQQAQNPHNQRGVPSAPPGLDPQHRLLAEQDFLTAQRRPMPPSGLPPFFDHHDPAILEHNIPPPGLGRRNTEGNALSGGPPQQQNMPPRQGPPPGQNGQASAQASNLGIPSLRMNELFMRNGGGVPQANPHHQIPHDRMLQGHPPPGLLPGAPNPQNGAGGPPQNRAGMPPPPGFAGGMPPPPHVFPPGPPPFGMPGFFGPNGLGPNGPGPMGMPPMGAGPGGPPPVPQGFFGRPFGFDGPQHGGPMPNGPPQGDGRQRF